MDGKRILSNRYIFPSSQICSRCGYKNKGVKDVRVREWKCSSCTSKNERDINASINIMFEGVKKYIESEKEEGLYMKNTLKVIAALLVVILLIGIIDFVFVGDKEVERDDTKKEEKEELKDVELLYLVDDFVGYYEEIELTAEEKEEIIEIFDSLEYEYKENETDIEIVTKYKLKVGDKTLYLSEDDEEFGNLVYDDFTEIVETKNLKAKIKSYIQAKEIDSVYLFVRYDLATSDFVKIELSDEDKEEIKEKFSYDTLIEPINLMLAGKYVLVVDGEALAFDYLIGNYAMYDSKIVIMNGELDQILAKYINEECCSCCLDLEPNEDCAAMCCPCN